MSSCPARGKFFLEIAVITAVEFSAVMIVEKKSVKFGQCRKGRLFSPLLAMYFL